MPFDDPGGGPGLLAENAALRAEVEGLRVRVAELELLADTDTLTPLPNRRAFLREVERAARSIARHPAPVALMYVDVDGLKAINDAWGHAVGDRALCHVARILRREVRASDVVARIGGDEFGLLLDRLDERAAVAKGDALLEAVAVEPLDLGNASVALSLSLGVTMVLPNELPEAALSRSDARMYASKSAQRSDR